jgi:hypothetical protein
LPHVVLQRLDHLAIDELEQSRSRLDHGSVDAQRRQHRRVFDADHSAAHDRGRARYLVVLFDQEAVGVEHAPAIDRDLGVVRGARAAGDQHVVRRDLFRRLFAFDAQAMRRDEMRVPGQDAHAIALELIAKHLQLAIDDLQHAKRQIFGRDLLAQRVVAAIERALLEPREIEHGFAQRLAGDGSGVQTHAADHRQLVDNRDLLSQLRRGDRSLVTRRTTANHDQVEVRD